MHRANVVPLDTLLCLTDARSSQVYDEDGSLSVLIDTNHTTPPALVRAPDTPDLRRRQLKPADASATSADATVGSAVEPVQPLHRDRRLQNDAGLIAYTSGADFPYVGCFLDSACFGGSGATDGGT